MRSILIVFFVLLALPALAQQERECRGKKTFDLGDGAYGCLLDVGLTSIRTTTTRDDGASKKTNSNIAGGIAVALFGAHSSSKKVITRRVKQICKTFLPDLKAANPNARYYRVVVELIWPGVPNSGDFVPKTQSEAAVQPAFTSDKCRGVKYFR